MKKKIITTIVLAVMLCAVVGVTQSYASCGLRGKIFYIYYNSAATTPYAYVYSAPQTTFPTYSIYFLTYDTELIAALSSAFSGGDTVYLTGNADACPDSGTYRYGGTLQYSYFYKNY
ncbi:MAG: hypothetical protein GY874_09270 [Desulfobacteraceae bacterium]|nr:hypothetical protein [Desulfobacteraceae bacterium]